MRIMTVFLKSNKTIPSRKNFVSKTYHLMKTERLYRAYSETKLIFWPLGKTAKKKQRSVGKIKVILFDF